MPEETKEKKEIEIPNVIRVGELADILDLSVSKIIGELMKNGVLATINEMVDFETASIIADDLGFTLIKKEAEEVEAKVMEKAKQAARPPVVTVMGHVDHGKTSLLDAIRETKVVEKESGGITQHIGAYQVEVKGNLITFLDTPGHEAFSTMRAHGANITDVVVLVVAADDGVKPQTLESISLAKTANLPIVVAINKIDKPDANKDKVLRELADAGLVPEEWGGDTVMVPVSAKTKEGLDKLLEMIQLSADVKELKAAVGVSAQGVVIESNLDPGKGPLATVLIQNGILKEGEIVQVGGTYGRIKTMEDYAAKKLKEAGPAVPVQISGLKEVPQVADFLQVYPDEKTARQEATKFMQERSAKKLFSVKKIGLDEITAAVKQGEVKELNIVLKADVQGSLDALLESIGKIRNEEVAAKIVKQGVGEISDSDIALAKDTGSIIIGFKVGISADAKLVAQKEKVTYSIYDVIYELLSDIKKGLSSLLTPEIKETDIGKLKVLKIFMTTRNSVILGGKVTDGKIMKGTRVDILRDKEIIATGGVSTVQREKDEVPEVIAGNEGGAKLMLDKPRKVKEGDSARFYQVEEIQRSL